MNDFCFVAKNSVTLCLVEKPRGFRCLIPINAASVGADIRQLCQTPKPSQYASDYPNIFLPAARSGTAVKKVGQCVKSHSTGTAQPPLFSFGEFSNSQNESGWDETRSRLLLGELTNVLLPLQHPIGLQSVELSTIQCEVGQ
jgi:hypothetical protein